MNDVIQVDSERMLVTALGTPLTVTRGAQSTTVASHSSGAAVQDLTVTASATTLTLASTTGIAAGATICGIDSEKVLVGTVTSPRVTVTRGQLSTAAAAHSTAVAVSDITTAASDLTIATTNTSGFAVNDYIQIDNEITQITGITTNVSFTVTSRGQLNTAPEAHQSPATIFDISANTASTYFSFLGNATTPGATCNAAIGVGCAVKLTQIGLQ